MFGSIGMPELIIIMVVALIVFGPRKLPELGRSIGRSLNEFKKASNELRSTLEDEVRVEEQRDQRTKLEAERAATVAPSPSSAPTILPPSEGDGTATTAPVADETVSRTIGTRA